MKKLLRFIVILLIIIAVGVVVLGLLEPKDVTVERSLTMNASPEAVFDQMVHFKNWVNWSPWYKSDPTSQITYSGEDGKPGSSFHWVGDPKKSGEGTMTNKEVNGTAMNYDLQFMKPREGKADGYIRAEDAGNGMTKAVWGFKTHMDFPMNAMLAFMNMDKMLGKDFEAGLKNIKDFVEKNPGPSSGAFTIVETQFPGHNYAVVRKTVSWDDLSKFFGDTYGMLGKAAGSQINGAAAGLYYTWDTVKHQTDVAAGFPVADKAVVKGATMVAVPASKAYEVVYTGAYSGMMGAHMALGKRVHEKGETPSLVLEEYVKGPGDEKDSTKYVTNIYYLVK